MWSIGCIAYQLLVGVTPFQASSSFEQLYQRIVAAEFSFPDDIPLSDMAKDFVRCLLVADPEKRSTAGQALRHPWIRLTVPPGYLLLLLEFNHEADQTRFSPPSLEILNDTGPSADLWGLRPPGSEHVPLLGPRTNDPHPLDTITSDSTLGRTVRARWEQQGRPGVLQVPASTYSDHDGPADYSGSIVHDAQFYYAPSDGYPTSGPGAGAFAEQYAFAGPPPDLITPIKRTRSISDIQGFQAGGTEDGEMDISPNPMPAPYGYLAAGGPPLTSHPRPPAWFGDTTPYFGTPNQPEGQYVPHPAPYGTFMPGVPGSWTPIWDGNQMVNVPVVDGGSYSVQGMPMPSWNRHVPGPLQMPPVHGGHFPMDSPVTELQLDPTAAIIAVNGVANGSPDSQPSLAEGRSNEFARVRGLLSDLVGFGVGQGKR